VSASTNQHLKETGISRYKSTPERNRYQQVQINTWKKQVSAGTNQHLEETGISRYKSTAERNRCQQVQINS